MYKRQILYTLAASFSKTSKGLTQGKTEACAARLTEMAGDDFFVSGNDAFVMGHVHLPVIREFPAGTFIILGDWETHFSYARLEDGLFTLESYQSEGETVRENR